MAYTPQTWQDLPSHATLVTAATLTHIETGLQTAAAVADAAGVLPYTPGIAYTAGQVVLYSQAFYTANTSFTAGAFNSAQWTAITGVSGAVTTVDGQAGAVDLSSTYVPRAITQTADLSPVTPFKIVPADGTSAPYDESYNSFLNADTAHDHNHGMWRGYNTGYHTGVPILAGQPGWLEGMEQMYYDPGNGTYGPEWYIEAWSPDGVTTQMQRPYYARRLGLSAADQGPYSFLIASNIGAPGGTGSFVVLNGNTGYGQTALFTVSNTGITAALPLAVTADQIVLVSNAGSGATLTIDATSFDPNLTFQVAGVTGWYEQVEGVNTFKVYDKSNRAQMIHTYGASAAAATTEIAAAVKVDGVLAVGSGTATPTLAVTASLGTSPPAPTIVGNAARGVVSFGSGSGAPGPGGLVIVTLPAGYTGNPVVVVSPANYATAAKIAYVIQPGDQGLPANQFMLALQAGPAISQPAGTYAFSYEVIG